MPSDLPQEVTDDSRLPASRGFAVVAGALIMLAGFAAYFNSLSGPFVFDDVKSITENETIRQLWPLSVPLTPPQGVGATVEGRPVLNLSLALNYAFGQLDVRGYHAVNIIIHVLAAFALMGIVRRTLELPACRERFADAAPWLGFSVALLWMLHPLQTAAVTYVIQRAEVLAGLFYLLTLYAFIRGATTDAIPRTRVGWHLVAVFAAWLGGATKETVVTVPLIALLYDRTFLAGTFRGALRRRGWVHTALFAAWLPLFWLVLGAAGRGGTAGFGTNVGVWHYATTQCAAIVRYLGLSLWPHPLIFDYGQGLARSIGEVWLQALLLLTGLGGVGWLLVRRPALGFLGAWFFLLLAPSSSVVPVVTQTLAEHRMYLSLAAIIVTVVLATYAWLRQPGFVVLACVAVLLGVLTAMRNQTYRSEIVLWQNTVDQRPNNVRAQINLGSALVAAGRHDEAVPHWERAVELNPESATAQANLGGVRMREGRPSDAIAYFAAAVRIDPTFADAQYGLGTAHLLTDQLEEAEQAFLTTLRLDPEYDEARVQYANLLARSDRLDEAVLQYNTILSRAPDRPDVLTNLANTLLRLNQTGVAVGHLERLVELQPNAPDTHTKLAIALLLQGDRAQAEQHLREALRLDPDFQPAQTYLERLTTAP